MSVCVGVLIYLVWLSWKLRIAKHISLNCKQVDILWRILIIGHGKVPMSSFQCRPYQEGCWKEHSLGRRVIKTSLLKLNTVDCCWQALTWV
jgi:hypothetical protein